MLGRDELIKEDLSKNINTSNINKNQEKYDLNQDFGNNFSETISNKQTSQINLGKLFFKKEFLDRVGYGFAATQYVILFFFLIGTPIYLVGILNGLKDVLSTLFSFLIRQYMEFKKIKNNLISTSGIVFGFTFLIIAFAIKLKSILLFSIAFILGSISIVSYGELYTSLLNTTLKHEKRSWLLNFILDKGLIISAISFFISGIILQYFGLMGKVVKLMILDKTFIFTVNGYIIMFEIAAFAFIISGYLLSKIPSITTIPRTQSTFAFKTYITQLKSKYNEFKLNKRIKLMLTSFTLISLVQCLGTTYYAWFIYLKFKDLFFGGFLNIAIIFGFAIIISFVGPSFAKLFKEHLGLAPMFVFGTLLIGLLPLTLIYNPHFLTILFSNSIAVIGASILGVAQGLLARKLLNEYERKVYFESLGLSSILPFLIFIPICSIFAHFYGLELLFKVMIIMLVFIITPINLRLVVMSEKQKV